MPSRIVHSTATLIQGDLVPPGDKSISHRAVMFGALAEGTSSFTGFLNSEDCISTVKAFRAMGVDVRLEAGDTRVLVKGAGLHGLKAPAADLDLGNSGTSMRLILGILSGQPFEAVLTGDASLTGRPMKRVTVPLKQMGAQIKGKDNGNFAPLKIRGGKLRGIEYENRLGSAQVKSALLFAGIQAEGPTRIHEPLPSRDHTERFLAAAGASFRQEGDWLIAEKTEKLAPIDGAIPGDMSAAAFFITAAAMIPGSELLVKGVSLNPTRTGFLKVLERMGAGLEVAVETEHPEPMGSVHVTGCRLRGTRIAKPEIPSLIDELPMLMVAMALSDGESLVSGAEELRVKETDRIHSMTENLRALGSGIEELPDGCLIRGAEKLAGGRIRSFSDHRTVMSLSMASLCMDGDLEIDDVSSVVTSYPGFWDDFERLRK